MDSVRSRQASCHCPCSICCHDLPDRSSLSVGYCNHPALDKDMKPHPTSKHPYSPNVEAATDPEAAYYWLQMADFYSWPHITYFDDAHDLEQKLQEADFIRIHKLMVKENEHRKAEFLDNLCKVTQRIERGRAVPQDYDRAIKQLYGTSRLQVS